MALKVFARTDDPDHDAWLHDHETDDLPVCDCCGEPITDECLYEIGNEVWCERCVDGLRVYVDTWMDRQKGV